jgi:site-specific recombinase XerD
MPDFAPLPAPQVGTTDTLPVTVQELAAAFAQASSAANTRRAYRADWRAFTAWCAQHGVPALPCTATVVAGFLAAEAARGLKAASLERRAAAIRSAHVLAGHDDPTRQEAVKRIKKGIRRTLGSASRQKEPATAEVLAAMLSHCPATLIGQRDRALLALGFAGAFRRSELVALDVSDLHHEPAGLRITIRSSKTDQEGEGQTIAIPHGRHLKPTEALTAWLQAASITDGPVFRSVNRHGGVSAARLSDRTVATVVKHYAGKAGLNAAGYSGHSLRAGFVTTAADRDVNETRIMDVTRHKDTRTLRGYIRRANLFKGHAGSSFL